MKMEIDVAEFAAQLKAGKGIGGKEKGDSYIRIELDTFKVTDSYNLSPNESKKIIKLTKKHHKILIGGWNEYFKASDIN